MSPVFDRNAIALPDHNLVGRDRRRLGRLHVRSVRLDVRDCPERDSPDNSGYCGQTDDLAHLVSLSS
jgi:hypothetical protein